MSQEESDEKKLEKIRKMLDNPQTPLSNDSHDKYLATLQKRLTHDSSYQPVSLQKTSGSDDLTPSVIIHHGKTSSIPAAETSESQIAVKEAPMEHHAEFDDEELFEIERVETPSIPEFIEVKPADRKEETVHKKTSADSNDKDSSEKLPQWYPVEGETSQVSSPEVTKPTKGKQPKQKRKLPRPFKGSVVKQNAREPEIWEGEEQREDEKKKSDSSPWEPAEEHLEKEKTSGKTSKKPVFARFDKKSAEKKPISPTQKEPAVEKKVQGTEHPEKDVFSYGDYTLYKKQLRIGGKEIRTVHFFSKDTPEDSTPCTLPSGYEVKINEKTGVPYIRKIR